MAAILSRPQYDMSTELGKAAYPRKSEQDIALIKTAELCGNNVNRNTSNAFQIVFRELEAIMSRPQYVNQFFNSLKYVFDFCWDMPCTEWGQNCSQ